MDSLRKLLRQEKSKEDADSKPSTLSQDKQVTSDAAKPPDDTKAVKVTFVVTLPPYTPLTDSIYIAGNFNGWNAAGAHMHRSEQQHASETLTFMENEHLEYKYTRGGWNSVEKGPNLEETPNRVLNVVYGTKDGLGSGTMIVNDTVSNWSDSETVFQQGLATRYRGDIERVGNIEYMNAHCSVCDKETKLVVDTGQRDVILGGRDLFDTSLALGVYCGRCNAAVHSSTCAARRPSGMGSGFIFVCPRCGGDLGAMRL